MPILIMSIVGAVISLMAAAAAWYTVLLKTPYIAIYLLTNKDLKSSPSVLVHLHHNLNIKLCNCGGQKVSAGMGADYAHAA